MKLFTKIFLQVACVILILSSAVFFYTSYRWKNQSIQYINNYEYTKFQNNLLQFEEKLRLTSSQSANSDEKVRNRILSDRFSMTVLFYIRMMKNFTTVPPMTSMFRESRNNWEKWNYTENGMTRILISVIPLSAKPTVKHCCFFLFLHRVNYKSELSDCHL